MAVKIRLKRLGKIRSPYYRVVIADSRTKRDGRVIEEIGKYDPTQNPSLIEIKSDRALYWLGVGAQPTEQVRALLRLTGDLAKHNGEEDTSSKVQYPEAKQEFVANTEKAPVLIPKAEEKAAAKEEQKKDDKAEETPEAEKQDAPAATDQPAESEEAK